ncbi:hypothetical protein [Streptomyces sp. SID3212]|uniref:hypothetical protein n=1 Tax=Streptomyces sp. SID3212 TaxID=2690259 RepID=UPI001368793F|nr:hypothetical protein [Streptomyces sp. SID3212]MYV50998.1 hypothetical protein [Streptomyces sp. SID3212]
MSEFPQWVALAELPGVEVVGYGINRPGRFDPEGIPMLRAGDIADGRIESSEVVRVKHEVAEAHPRTRLRSGDLLIVLVGRIGEAALTGPDHEDWNVARTVALVRCADPRLAQWLRIWLATPTARAWCETQAAGTVQRTLGLRSLRHLPVALPSLADQDRALRVISAIESRARINDRIARTAVALGDAYFGVFVTDGQHWPRMTFGDVVGGAWTGTAARPAVASGDEGWVAPADVLRAPLPYVGITDSSGPPGVPGPILVVPKAGQVHAAVSRSSVKVSRGVLVLDPQQMRDAWWLLHEIRSRSTELSQLAQGTAGRELSARAFSQATVAWPPEDVLVQFAGLANRLHGRSLAAQRENRVLHALRSRFLRTLEPAAAPIPA